MPKSTSSISTKKRNINASHNNDSVTASKTTLFAVAVTILLMAFIMPSFIQRLFRPMSTAMGITGAGGGSPRPAIPEGAEKATVGAGCFWGVEHLYRKHFGDKGLYDARVGYTGGDATNPNYKQVCSGKTGRESPSMSQ
jgi:peptide-methionine (S)-S-oxide reductase